MVDIIGGEMVYRHWTESDGKNLAHFQNGGGNRLTCSEDYVVAASEGNPEKLDERLLPPKKAAQAAIDARPSKPSPRLGNN